MNANDADLIHEAEILAGLKEEGQILCVADSCKCALILSEMRAETERSRLANRIAWSFGLPSPTSHRPSES